MEEGEVSLQQKQRKFDVRRISKLRYFQELEPLLNKLVRSSGGWAIFFYPFQRIVFHSPISGFRMCAEPTWWSWFLYKGMGFVLRLKTAFFARTFLPLSTAFEVQKTKGNRQAKILVHQTKSSLGSFFFSASNFFGRGPLSPRSKDCWTVFASFVKTAAT